MRLSLLALSAFCVSSLAAHADTMFDLQNVILTNGTTVSGTVDINTTTGVFDSGSFMSKQGTTSYVFDTLSIQATNYHSQSYAYFTDAKNDYFILDLPVASLVGYSGSPLCSTSMSCGGYVGGIALSNNTSFPVLSGSLETAATPEPSSLVLLGTGIFGAVGVIRRRLA